MRKLKKSAPVIKKGSKPRGTPDANKVIEVILSLRGKDDKDEEENEDEFEQHMSLDEIKDRFGAYQEDIEKIELFAKNHHLDVVRVDRVFCDVTLSGTIKAFKEAFDVEIKQYEHPDFPGHLFHAHDKDISLPDELHGIVRSVFGLCNQPMVKPQW